MDFNNNIVLNSEWVLYSLRTYLYANPIDNNCNFGDGVRQDERTVKKFLSRFGVRNINHKLFDIKQTSLKILDT